MGGSQTNANAFVSHYYPITMRSTSIGWANGIGRIGGMLGPTLFGMLLAMNYPVEVNFMAFAIPSILSAILLMFVNEKQVILMNYQQLK